MEGSILKPEHEKKLGLAAVDLSKNRLKGIKKANLSVRQLHISPD